MKEEVRMTALDILLDSAASDINHPAKHLHLERYTYSGQGLEGYNFKEGEVVYEVTVNVWSVSGSGRDKIIGFGRSLENALVDTRNTLRSWLSDRVKNAKVRVKSEQETLAYYETMVRAAQESI